MQLFYAPGIVPPYHTLGEEESRHCVKVLRMAEGDELRLTDGRGNLHTARIVKADPRRCEVEVVESVPGYGRRDYSLTVAAAPTKNAERFDWFLEKATEVGVDRVIPVECANSERRTFRTDRGAKIMAGAMKQSLKAYLPQLDPLTDFREVAAMPFDGVKLIAHCRADLPREPLVRALPKGCDALILIGPEGDFTSQETDLALRSGFTGVTLGDSRLRTETAALAAVMAAYFINQS